MSTIVNKLKDFSTNTRRIFRVARRPTAKEVRLIARVSGIGILICGGVAYLIQILGHLMSTFFKPEQPTGGSIISAIILMTRILLSSGVLNPANIMNTIMYFIGLSTISYLLYQQLPKLAGKFSMA
ncbi:MAG: protein translocase SEC61 complex subunit gamma [Candidatus Hodarchaeota archaeon]